MRINQHDARNSTGLSSYLILLFLYSPLFQVFLSFIHTIPPIHTFFSYLNSSLFSSSFVYRTFFFLFLVETYVQRSYIHTYIWFPYVESVIFSVEPTPTPPSFPPSELASDYKRFLFVALLYFTCGLEHEHENQHKRTRIQPCIISQSINQINQDQVRTAPENVLRLSDWVVTWLVTFFRVFWLDRWLAAEFNISMT